MRRSRSHFAQQTYIYTEYGLQLQNIYAQLITEAKLQATKLLIKHKGRVQQTRKERERTRHWCEYLSRRRALHPCLQSPCLFDLTIVVRVVSVLGPDVSHQLHHLPEPRVKPCPFINGTHGGKMRVDSNHQHIGNGNSEQNDGLQHLLTAPNVG